MEMSPLYTDSRLYVYFTYAFTHVHWIHLISSVLTIALIGWYIEPRVKTKLLLILTILAIPVCGCMFTITNDGSVAGASGLSFAYLSLFVCLWPERKFNLFGVFPVPAKMVLFGLMLFDIIMYAQNFNQVGGIAHVSHLTGVLIGYLFYNSLKEYYEMKMEIRLRKRWRSVERNLK